MIAIDDFVFLAVVYFADQKNALCFIYLFIYLFIHLFIYSHLILYANSLQLKSKYLDIFTT